MKINYENLIKKLDEKYKKVNDNEFIIKEIERTGQDYKLKVIQAKKLKNAIKELENIIISHQKEAEKSKIVYGIIFSPNYLVFLRVHEDILQKISIQKLKRDLNKITLAFEKKYKNFLKDPGDMASWDQIYDRTDIIEEFYVLYSKAKEKLIKNVQGIHDDINKEEFSDNLLVQLLIIWYLQEKKFLNDDKKYLVNRFKDYNSLGFKDFYSFLRELFNIMMSTPTNGVFNDKSKLGKIVVTGTAPFINGEFENLKIKISDETFYRDGETDILQKAEPKNITDVSILNLFDSRDWTEGNIDEYVLGAIYEKLISHLERKKSGTYYTPEEVTSYINKNTITPYIIEKINQEFNSDFETFENIIEETDIKYYFAIFKILNHVKILDPAVGSAHFLESSINALVEIYLIIWEKLSSLGVKEGLKIITLNESGQLEKLDILEINDSEKLRLYLKFFIILTRNVYGVDINPSALKIAKARLFLSLAKHFNVKKNYFIQFPNVHFNLRRGNSLIGYVDLIKEDRKEQQQIDIFLETKEKKEFSEKISIIVDLKEFLIKISNTLNIKMDIVKGIGKLNTILNKDEIPWNDFVIFLKIKENLIKILIASLNSSYAKPLNDLLNQMTECFNNKLDQKFANEYNLDLDNLRKVHTFHWIFEFPEVFLKKKGFDIILGNPPFVRADTEDDVFITQREILMKLRLYETLWEKWDLFVAFIERSIKYLLKEKGKFSFIVSDAICTVKYAERIREWIQNNFSLPRIDYFEGFEVFKGIGINPIILFVNKDEKKSMVNKRIHLDNFFNIVKDSNVNQNSEFLWKKLDAEILKYELGETELLKNICYISYGLRPNADEKTAKGEFTKDDLISDSYSNINSKMYIEGKNIQRYKINKIRYLEWNTDRCPNQIARKTFIELYQGKKVFCGTIVEGLIEYNEIICNHSLIVLKRFIDLKEVNNKSILSSISKNNKDKNRQNLENISLNYNYEQLIAIINSKFANKYLNAIRRHKLENFFYPDDYRDLPIKRLNDQSVFIRLVHIIQFLYQSEQDNKYMKFFDDILLNALIYELYFKEKLEEVRLYQNLMELSRQNLKDIEYERWIKLAFKDLVKEELIEKEKLEKDILESIEEMFNSLNTKDLMEKISQMKEFEWIKKIEGN